MFVPARDRRTGLTTPTVSYYDWFWNVSTVFSVWWPWWLHVFRDWYGDRADCTCSMTDDDRADCTCSVTDMMTVQTARVPWFIHTNRSICIYVYRNLFSLFRAISALSENQFYPWRRQHKLIISTWFRVFNFKCSWFPWTFVMVHSNVSGTARVCGQNKWY
jgi:hypothetical protein